MIWNCVLSLGKRAKAQADSRTLARTHAPPEFKVISLSARVRSAQAERFGTPMLGSGQRTKLYVTCLRSADLCNDPEQSKSLGIFTTNNTAEAKEKKMRNEKRQNELAAVALSVQPIYVLVSFLSFSPSFHLLDAQHMKRRKRRTKYLPNAKNETKSPASKSIVLNASASVCVIS